MFRRIGKTAVALILRAEARLVLRKYQPKIVAVIGSVGKTGAKEAIAAVLATRYRVRASPKSFNSEIGLPLTILGCDNAWHNPFGWFRNFIDGLSLLLFRSDYPEWLVLEVGVDRPGDMAAVARWLPVKLVAVTSLPAVPVHVEFFKSAETLAQEKWRLAQGLTVNGLAVLNADDEQIMRLASNLKCRTITYGFQSEAIVRGSEVRLDLTTGLTFRLDYDGNSVPFHLRGALGAHQVYACLAAVAVGLTEGINLAAMSEALTSLRPSPGRMCLLPGIKATTIIDDSYNASPVAVLAALNTLSELRVAGRKIAVLGDMLELGKYAIEEHRKVGRRAAEVAHVLVTVGLRMKFAVEEAMRKKMAKKNVYHFDDSRAAGKFLQNFISEDDVILVKGSQSFRMERVVEEIMAQPENKTKLLVRQEPEWLNKF